MANQRAQVDASWFAAGPVLDALGEPVRVITPEVVVWDKLYIMQLDRSDWPDALNLLEALARGCN